MATVPKAVQLLPPLLEYCQLPRPEAASMAIPRLAASLSLARLASRLLMETPVVEVSSLTPVKV